MTCAPRTRESSGWSAASCSSANRRRTTRARPPDRTIGPVHRGVRVFGADVTRQLAGGQAVSVFGAVYDDLEVDTTPTVSEREARGPRGRAGVPIGPARGRAGGPAAGRRRRALTWRIRAATADDVREYFVDAHSGASSRLQRPADPVRGRPAPPACSAIRRKFRPCGRAAFLLEDGLRPPLSAPTT